jgi:hypothetical protein
MRTAALSLLLLACGGEDTGKTGSQDTGAAADTDTDTNQALVTACVAERWVQQTCSGCHLEGSHIDLRYDALETLVQSDRESHPGPIVVPGDPDASLVVRKVEAKVGRLTLEADEGHPMPLDTEISDDDAQLIRDWVALGAVLPSGC